MLAFLFRRYIDRMERRYHYDASYMREMLDAAPAAFRRFARIQSLGGGWSGGAPRTAFAAAGIAAVVLEDCGPCVQIASDMAIERGISGAVIAALLSGAPTDADAQLGFDYGRALLGHADNLDDLREAIEKKWGRAALIGLTLQAMTARNYPVLKRALGHAKSCQKVRILDAEIVVEPSLKAA